MSIKFNYHTNANQNDELFQTQKQQKLLAEFNNIINDPDLGFFHLTNKTEFLNSTRELTQKYQTKKHFVQIGIGGSALGPQMLINALQKDFTKSFHLFDNVDSDQIQRELNKIKLTETLFYVVSKSGGTAETLAGYAIAREALIQAGVSEKDFHQYFVFCTEHKNSELMQHIKQHNFDALEVPLNVGGRFSVLTHVGLFPACFFGINIEDLYAGANALKQNMLNENLSKNDLIQTAAHILFLYEKANPIVNQTVLMPYSSILKDLSSWFVQLWAESLGKWSETQKKHIGLTPVPAYGATDQHSQVQLFMEGPADKLIFMLKVDQTKNDFSLKNNVAIKGCQLLSPYQLNQLMLAEFMGTLKALRENKRDVIEVVLNEVNEANLGGLILFFESLTALVGRYLEINPFDQPGVEKGKIYTFEYLKTW